LEEKHEFTEEDVWIVARELFDEERLSIQSGDSFTTFKEKYEQGEALQPESHEAAPEPEPESVEQLNASVEEEHVGVTEAETESVKAGEGKLAPEFDYWAEVETEAEEEVEVDSTLTPETEKVADSEKETEEAEHISEFYPYGESGLFESDTLPAAEAQAAEESAVAVSTDETERIAQPIASGKTYLDESELDALTSKIIREGDIRIEEASTETGESSPDEILNLPSMQAERRKHEIDEKGGWISTAETVEVDELFTGTFSRSLRNIFIFVLAGLFFLILFVIKPERIDQVWEGTVEKIPSMIKPAEEQDEVESPSTETERQTPEKGDSQASKADEKTTTEAPIETSITDKETVLLDKQAPVEADDETSPIPDYTESAVETDLVERASKDYIATQSKYQKVEIGEGAEETIVTAPITRKFQIYFEFDNPNIPDQFKEMLNDLYIVLSLNKASTMTITGYTDASGDPVYNMRLSTERANAVARYFTEKGIGPDRIQVEGRGPVPKSTSEEYEELEKRFGNRRVEIILSEGGK
jgi:outer membrane protein OmpA-like peptidoglycan-associated protein